MLGSFCAYQLRLTDTKRLSTDITLMTLEEVIASETAGMEARILFVLWREG